ncbi:MAG: hypothetical protein JW999_08415 [Methanotrichaceae archaeon]|nr:hypothetical protein [Methanotrichaceae archaeon]
MLRRGIMLLLLATLLAGSALGNGQGDAQGDVTTIPASQDVYISMGGNIVSVYNQTDFLLCAVNMPMDGNETEKSYPGVPAVQFDISSLNITEDDVAVLVLKAASIQKQKDPILVALMSIGSDWEESSDYTTFLVNILPAWNIIKKNDATLMSSNTDGDPVFAFDVSKKLMDARAKGDKISFLLEANSNSSTEISFLSRESGQGPCLMIMPYPVSLPQQATQPDLQNDSASAQELSSSLQPDQDSNLAENINQTGEQEQAEAEVPVAPMAIAAGITVPVAGRTQSNQSMEVKLELPPGMP